MIKEKTFKRFSNIKGDFSGALSAAIITLPMSIGYGLLAFAPLGSDYAPQAALIGVYSALFAGFFAAMFGGTPIQITGPKAPLTLVSATVVASLVTKVPVSESGSSAPAIILGLAALCVLIGGLSQIAFGALGLGNLVKYVPYPVVAGFMNGIALLLVVKQIKPLLGLESKIAFVEIMKQPAIFQPLTFLAGIVTIMTIFLSKRIIKAIPPTFVGLGVGTFLYYLFQHLADPSSIGGVIGHFNVQWPRADIFPQLYPQLKNMDGWLFLPDLLIAGLALGLLGSMESLLSSVISDNLTGTRHNSKRELIGQGIGNIASALFGSLPAAGSIPRSMANFNAGGRTRLSGMMCSVLIFLMIVILGPFVGKIPIVVIAAIIFVVGISLFDSWTLHLLKKVITVSEHRKKTAIDLFVTLVVAIVTVSINLVVAVCIGVLIASALFISRTGKSIIKRKYFGDQFHSRKMRSLEHTEVLERQGGRILILELQGPLFFGSAENLAKEIESSVDGFTYCIIDMKRVNEIDSTGANILLQIKKRFHNDKKYLLLSYVKGNPSLQGVLATMAMGKVLNNYTFPDTDDALEWAENHLLESFVKLEETTTNLNLSQMDVLRNFTAEEFEVLRRHLVYQQFNKGEVVFYEGDEGRDLFFLNRGFMSVKIYLPENNRPKRLYTYAPGVIFGEMAFLDGNRRSAGVWAEEVSEVLRLPFENFQSLRHEKPQIAAKLIDNIALELSRRLRRTSNQVRLLEDG